MKVKLLFTGILMVLAQPVLASSAPIQNAKTSFVISSYAQTKYPIVLAHGLFGFNKLGTEAFGLDYWYQIPQDLAKNGANVWATRQSAANTSEVRGEQLLAEVQDILAITGAQKVNLIGHSHGSQSVRYVAGVLPDRVASVSTVGGPAKGAPLADLIYKSLAGTVLEAPIATLVNAATNLITIGQLDDPHQYPMDSLGAAYSLSTEGANKFNATFSAGVPTTACGQGAAKVNGIQYYSWSGASVLTNPVDPTDYLLGLTSVFSGQNNDGLVPACSSHIGTVIRDNYVLNHLDEVNQVLGLRSVFAQDPVSIFRQHANRLKLQGL